MCAAYFVPRILLDLISLKISDIDFNLSKSSKSSFLHPIVSSSILRANIIPNTLLRIPQSILWDTKYHTHIKQQIKLQNLYTYSYFNRYVFRYEKGKQRILSESRQEFPEFAALCYYPWFWMYVSSLNSAPCTCLVNSYITFINPSRGLAQAV
jgi:hypothetical protein